MKIAEDILRESKRVGIDPYKDPFRPSDLGLNASDYGSFSDWCEDTTSARWNQHVCLEAAKFRKDNKPLKYILLPKTRWVYGRRNL